MLTIDKTHDMIETLIRSATIKKEKEITAVNSYYDGYVQGCEDFGKYVRQELYTDKSD